MHTDALSKVGAPCLQWSHLYTLWCFFKTLVKGWFDRCHLCRVGQNHLYTVCIRYFWQGNHQKYGHIRCIYMVLANPTFMSLVRYVYPRNILAHPNACRPSLSRRNHSMERWWLKNSLQLPSCQQPTSQLMRAKQSWKMGSSSTSSNTSSSIASNSQIMHGSWVCNKFGRGIVCPMATVCLK